MKTAYKLHIANEITIAIQTKDKVLHCVVSWIELEGVRLIKTNQKEKNKHCIISFICDNTIASA